MNYTTPHSDAAYDIKELSTKEQFVISLLRKNTDGYIVTITKADGSFDISIREDRDSAA